jgi:hypothetical protein
MRVPKGKLTTGLVALLGCLAIVALTGSQATAQRSANSRRAFAARPASAPQRKLTKQRVSRLLMAHFGLLQDAHVADLAAAPVSVQNRIADINSRAGSALGLDLSATQEVAGGSAGSIWVVPGTSGICAVTASTQGVGLAGPPVRQISYGHCENTATALRYGLVAVALQPDRSDRVYGLVPNGNTTIVADASGSPVTIPVNNNAVAEDLPTVPTSLRFRDSTGTATQLP